MFEDVEQGLAAQTRAVQHLFAHLTSGGEVDLASWVELVGVAQELVNAATAVQTYALARAAAIEDVDLADGTVVERDMGLGYARMDAPGLVSGILGLTDQGAVGRVETSVALASQMPCVLAAMAAGRLDGWRASVVTDELREASAEVAGQVACVIEPHLGTETAGRLRNRVRRVLHAIDPDLVRTQAEQARVDRELRRFVEQVGTDTWIARIPIEQARPAFAVIDELAMRYRTERGLTIGQARVDAMVDLIQGHADVSYRMMVCVPERDVDRGEVASEADPCAGERVHDDSPDAERLVAVRGFGSPGETLVRHGWLATVSGSGPRQPTRPPSGAAPSDQVVRCDSTTGAMVSAAHDVGTRRAVSLTTTRYRPTEAIRTFVKARDGSCRFPGCTVSARFCDLDHVIPWTDPGSVLPAGPVGGTEPANLICLCRRHHRTKQRRRWKVRLRADGTVEWTAPTGRRSVTSPVDHLGVGDPVAVTPATTPADRAAASPTRGERPDEFFSWLEEHLRDRLALHEAALAEAQHDVVSAANRPRRQATAHDLPPF